MDIADIAVDTDKIEQGAWVDEIPEMGELRLKVRGTNNADYQRMMQKLVGAIPRAKRQGGRIDPIEIEKVAAVCMHATVLLDWDGLRVGGQPAPYSKELAHTLLTDPKYRRFRNAVAWAAGEIDGTNAEAEAEDAGN